MIRLNAVRLGVGSYCVFFFWKVVLWLGGANKHLLFSVMETWQVWGSHLLFKPCSKLHIKRIIILSTCYVFDLCFLLLLLQFFQSELLPFSMSQSVSICIPQSAIFTNLPIFLSWVHQWDPPCQIQGQYFNCHPQSLCNDAVVFLPSSILPFLSFCCHCTFWILLWLSTCSMCSIRKIISLFWAWVSSSVKWGVSTG